MARKRTGRPNRRKPGSHRPTRRTADDDQGLLRWAQRYLVWMRVKNYSPRTIESADEALGRFLEWCELRSVNRPHEVSRAIIDTYQRYTFMLRTKSGKPLAFSSQTHRLVPVRGFFRYLSKQGVLMFNPAADLELPKVPRRIPRNILTPDEVEVVLRQIDTRTVLGIRDRAIIETFYSTGIRRAELSKLALYDVDFGRMILTVREGKGRRDRMVPIGERALAWIQKYLDESRPELVVEPDEGVLFLGYLGDEMGLSRMTQMVGGYVEGAKLKKHGACHLFRHSMATSMLEAGADLRFIQTMLGHEQIRSTQVYTHVAIKKLQEVHRLTHPTAVLQVTPDDEADDEGE